MEEKFSYLKANEKYAQYWFRESPNSNVVPLTPKQHPYRSVFSCDRDRVMYCSAFRRLSSKTQVFNSQVADNLRTRLTHTLEVSQIARTISAQLGLDQELTEAISLGHDVGHTPFGHVGERTINKFSIGEDKRQVNDKITIDEKKFGFKHNLQSVRVLTEYSENVKFSNFMLFGVREHSKLFWNKSDDVKFYEIYEPYCSYSKDDVTCLAWSFEAYIVKWSDEIAQRHHDIEDAFFQKIIPADDIVNKVEPLVKLINDESITHKFNRLRNESNNLQRRDSITNHSSFAHTLSSFLVDAYVTILIKEFKRVLKHFSNVNKIKNSGDFEKKYTQISVDEIRRIMKIGDSKIYEVDKILGESLKYSILDSYEVQRMDGKGAYIIRKLIRAYTSNPQQLPSEYVNRFIKIELVRLFTKEQLEEVVNRINCKLNYGISANLNLWKDYECREALRIIIDDADLYKSTYSALIRVIFDYVAGMTDSYASKQYIDLY